MAEIYKLQFDGSISKNPGGVAAYGYILSYEDGTVLKSDHGIIGEGPLMTNNVAEYQGLIEGLKYFLTYHKDEQLELHIFGDSQLVIRQMKGEWSAKSDKLYYSYYQTAKLFLSIIAAYVNVSFTWVPREQNTACDDLSKVHRKKEI